MYQVFAGGTEKQQARAGSSADQIVRDEPYDSPTGVCVSVCLSVCLFMCPYVSEHMCMCLSVGISVQSVCTCVICIMCAYLP